jgi:hypothetical protein
VARPVGELLGLGLGPGLAVSPAVLDCELVAAVAIAGNAIDVRPL